MNKNILIAILAVNLTAPSAYAHHTVEAKSTADFDALTLEQMDPAKLYFDDGAKDAQGGDQDPITFAEWTEKSPVQAEYLALWKGYAEPEIPMRDGIRTTKKNLTVFVSRAKAILNKPAASINFAGMINIDFIRGLDATFMHEEINDPHVLMPNSAGKGPVRAFHWCNKDGQSPITRQTRETNLEMLNPPGRQWCENSERSKCVESCYVFSQVWTEFVTFANGAFVDPTDQKDMGVATQSEIRYYLSEEEMGMSTPVSQLTGVNSKVTGVLRQNIFYVNQAIQFGTITAIFQEYPGDPSKTIVTSYFTFAIGTSTWSGYKGMLSEILMGRGGGLNTEEGITSGLPKYTQATALSILNILEK